MEDRVRFTLEKLLNVAYGNTGQDRASPIALSPGGMPTYMAAST